MCSFLLNASFGVARLSSDLSFVASLRFNAILCIFYECEFRTRILIASLFIFGVFSTFVMKRAYFAFFPNYTQTNSYFIFWLNVYFYQFHFFNTAMTNFPLKYFSPCANFFLCLCRMTRFKAKACKSNLFTRAVRMQYYQFVLKLCWDFFLCSHTIFSLHFLALIFLVLVNSWWTLNRCSDRTIDH